MEDLEQMNKAMRENLIRHRRVSMLTTSKIASILEIDRKTLAKYENDPVNVSISKIAKLCDLYGCTVKSLMD